MSESATNDKVIEVFAKVLGIPSENVTDDLRYASIPQWDSIAHMAVVSALEEQFGIMIDMDDVIDMNTVDKAREIVHKYSAEA
jgi:acyl carrier protein